MAVILSIVIVNSMVLGGEKISSSEEEFIKKASQRGIKEVELGKLAAKRWLSKEVKQFGKMMVNDHSKANKELAKLAAKKKVQIAKQMDEDHKSEYDRLAKLAGKEFDKEYVEAMVDDHEEDVEEFEEMAADAEDPDVKQFAKKTLPTLKKHLEHIEQLSKKMEAMED